MQGVKMSSESARELRELAIKRRVRLSAHAPYFINLNAKEPEKVAASRERIIQTARITSLLGGECIVFHPAYYLKDNPFSVYDAVKSNLEQITARLRAEGNRVTLRPEVMGKESQFGTLDEVLSLCAEVEGLAPTVDFAHWHARTGKANTYYEFTGILKRIKRKLGSEALSNMHIHVSGIRYGPRGENRHVDLAESDFQYEELLRALRYFHAGGMLICESPNLEEDALLLQQIYRKL